MAHLGKPELLRSCRLVQPVGENGAFSSFKAKSGAVRILHTFSILAGQREAERSPCVAGAGNPELAAPPSSNSSSMVSGALAWTCFRGQQAKSQPKMCLQRRACRRQEHRFPQEGSLFCDLCGEASLEPRSKPEVGRCERSFDELRLGLCFALQVKVAVPEPPKLSIAQVLALQHLGRQRLRKHELRAAWHSQRLMRDWQLRRDLLQGFSDPEFQQKRKDQCSKIVQDVSMSHTVSCGD